MEWHNWLDLVDVDSLSPEELEAQNAMLKLFDSEEMSSVDQVAWDEKPFPEEYIGLWKSRGIKVIGPGCLYVKFGSSKRVYTYPLRTEVK